VELLQKAALSPELDLAVRARYNLGCMAAAKAQKRFGEHPEKAAANVRKEGLADLAVAVSHFRECLRLDKEHADARHNLELVRLWMKSMESLWEQNDRQKQREEMDLAAFLQMLEEKQRELRTAARALADTGDSPKSREARRQAEMAQRKLGEEIGPLKEKIEATLSKAAPSAPPASGGKIPTGPAAVPEELKRAIANLQSLADEAGRAIEAAAGQLHAGKPAETVKPQTEVVEKFNQLYRAVAPYPNLLGRAVAAQQGLASSQVEKGSAAGAPQDAPESAWNQDFVTRYSEVLVPLAKEGLKQLQSVAPTPPAASPQSAQGGPAVNPEEIQKQREGMQRSMEKAVELGPKVETLAREAAQRLRDRKPAEASPKQQEALKLLKEIAEPLPKQKPPPQQNPKDQNKQNQNKQDQNKQDPKQQNQKQQEQKQQQEDSQQQAEAAIRQVQERQQKRQEMGKQLQQYLSRPGKVEKDW
jgi:hypothetical protein